MSFLSVRTPEDYKLPTTDSIFASNLRNDQINDLNCLYYQSNLHCFSISSATNGKPSFSAVRKFIFVPLRVFTFFDLLIPLKHDLELNVFLFSASMVQRDGEKMSIKFSNELDVFSEQSIPLITRWHATVVNNTRI